jgi:hypothetical protein
MPKFAIVVTTDDAKDTELYGRPYDAEGLQTGLEAAFSQNGLEVVEIHEVTDETHTSAGPIV